MLSARLVRMIEDHAAISASQPAGERRAPSRLRIEADAAENPRRARGNTGNLGMIVGTGVDIVKTSRIAQALERRGERFSKRLYTSAEIAYCEKFKNRAERYAARFAAKEAAFKALGTGWRDGVRWLDVEVTHLPSGKPELRLSGRAEQRARELGVTRMVVSLSHSDRYAVAQVIFEADG